MIFCEEDGAAMHEEIVIAARALNAYSPVTTVQLVA